MGDGKLVDSLINDGLWCAFDAVHMGAGHRAVHDRDRWHQPRAAGRARGQEPRARGGGDQGRSPRRGDRAGRGAAAQGRPDPRRERRGRPARHDHRVARLVAARVREGRHHHRRQRLADLRRRRGGRRDEPRQGRGARHRADRRARQLRDGRRPGPVAPHPAVALDQRRAREGEPARSPTSTSSSSTRRSPPSGSRRCAISASPTTS